MGGRGTTYEIWQQFRFQIFDLTDTQERNIMVTLWANFRLNESYCHSFQVEASHHVGAFDMSWVGDRAIKRAARTHA